MSVEFERCFKALTAHAPMKWQKRLFDQIRAGDVPSVIDLPTGLGKTMIIAIWLVARMENTKLPRRLIYVVDRRTVVDQATDVATDLQEFVGKSQVAVSALRGQLADNREWSRDPSLPAIIIGTVDLIGSALLFSGYRSSYKRRPLEAGLLGQDSLLVLDEAHLSKPFEKLVESITQFQSNQGSPLQVIRMSATSSATESENVFRLDEDAKSPTYDLKPDPDPRTNEERNQIIKRYHGKKRLTVAHVDSVTDAITIAAGGIAKKHPGTRIVIFVRTPKLVDDVRKALIKKDKSLSTKIALLTGTMRGLERDELVTPPEAEDQHERRVMQRFLTPDNDPAQGECLLISTSAGEVGFDLNADHLVCDVAPLDSMIQRLGRVNRRGHGDATVHLVIDNDPDDKTDMDKACKVAANLFSNCGTNVSPKALAKFKSKLSPEELKAASSPEPTMVELTDILLDAWSMTSITERMPGRPEVAPWLRGIAEDLPETAIAWRAELDVRGFDQLDPEDIEEWFDTHPIQTHESLSVPISVAAKWLADRWGSLTDAEQRLVGARSIIVERAGSKLVTVKALIDQLARKNTDSIRNAALILPASFGGVERRVGLLDPSAPTKPVDESNASDEARKANAEVRRIAPDVADERGRCREVVTRSEDGIPMPVALVPGTMPANPAKLALDLESEEGTRVQLISYVPKREKPEWGSKLQSLSEHVGLVRQRLNEILSRLDVPEPLRRGAELAANFHDHGKNRERWQRTVNGVATPPGKEWSPETRGKSGGSMRRDARRYRHEFGSLREFIDAHQGKLDQDVFDLAMHLIAVHHGRGRPHFPNGGFDPDAELRTSEIHAEVIRRFARLQRKYGWWQLAWLENLLRCADALASADQDGKEGTTHVEV
jgi:CRISPR-associated endonuclease/helicase Cas3